MEPTWTPRITRYVELFQMDPDDGTPPSALDIVLVLESQDGHRHHVPLAAAVVSTLSEALSVMLQSPNSPLKRGLPEPPKRH